MQSSIKKAMGKISIINMNFLNRSKFMLRLENFTKTYLPLMFWTLQSLSSRLRLCPPRLSSLSILPPWVARRDCSSSILIYDWSGQFWKVSWWSYLSSSAVIKPSPSLSKTLKAWAASSSELTPCFSIISMNSLKSTGLAAQFVFLNIPWLTQTFYQTLSKALKYLFHIEQSIPIAPLEFLSTFLIMSCKSSSEGLKPWVLITWRY